MSLFFDRVILLFFFVYNENTEYQIIKRLKVQIRYTINLIPEENNQAFNELGSNKVFNLSQDKIDFSLTIVN